MFNNIPAIQRVVDKKFPSPLSLPVTTPPRQLFLRNYRVFFRNFSINIYNDHTLLITQIESHFNTNL